jgi:hypothetical protein
MSNPPGYALITKFKIRGNLLSSKRDKYIVWHISCTINEDDRSYNKEFFSTCQRQADLYQ